MFQSQLINELLDARIALIELSQKLGWPKYIEDARRIMVELRILLIGEL